MLVFDEAGFRRIVREAVAEVMAKAAAAPAKDAGPGAELGLPLNLTDAEVCRAARVGDRPRSKTWLRAVRASGALKSTRFGGRYLTSREEMLRFLREGCAAIPQGGVVKSEAKPEAPGVVPLFGGKP